MKSKFLEDTPLPTVGLTPLIDVVFILLVFFMLATRFDQSEILSLESAASGEGAAVVTEAAQPMLLDLLPGRKLRRAGETVTLNDIVKNLPKGPLIVRLSKDVPLKEAVWLRDQLAKAGAKEVGFFADAVQ